MELFTWAIVLILAVGIMGVGMLVNVQRNNYIDFCTRQNFTDFMGVSIIGNRIFIQCVRINEKDQLIFKWAEFS